MKTFTGDYSDEWLIDSPAMKEFIDVVNKTRAREPNPNAIVRKIRPHFESLLANQEWLPQKYMEPAQDDGQSGMGGRTGMWLLYRAGDGGLAFSALVLPAGAQTPVHDHLAWGLVGLYRGEQEEEVFARKDNGAHDHHADLELAETNTLVPGDFYELLPENDIHRVRTTSDVTSVSLHLLGNDNGCIWRHRFQPEESSISPFKSGWLNVECREYEPAVASAA